VKYYISGIKSTYSSYTLIETKILRTPHRMNSPTFCAQNHTNTIILLSPYRGISAAGRYYSVNTIAALNAFQANSVSPSKSSKAKRYTTYIHTIYTKTLIRFG